MRGIAFGVLLSNAGAIGHADQVDLLGVDRLANSIQILDRFAGAVEAHIGMRRDFFQATFGRGA